MGDICNNDFSWFFGPAWCYNQKKSSHFRDHTRWSGVIMFDQVLYLSPFPVTVANEGLWFYRDSLLKIYNPGGDWHPGKGATQIIHRTPQFDPKFDECLVNLEHVKHVKRWKKRGNWENRTNKQTIDLTGMFGCVLPIQANWRLRRRHFQSMLKCLVLFGKNCLSKSYKVGPLRSL